MLDGILGGLQAIWIGGLGVAVWPEERDEDSSWSLLLEQAHWVYFFMITEAYEQQRFLKMVLAECFMVQ